MKRHYPTPNFLVMDASQKKELLHLRIEQANEQVLDALAEMAETLFKTWQPEVITKKETEPKSEKDYTAIYAENLRPMTHEEVNNELREAMKDYERGDYMTLDDMNKEATEW